MKTKDFQIFLEQLGGLSESPQQVVVAALPGWRLSFSVIIVPHGVTMSQKSYLTQSDQSVRQVPKWDIQISLTTDNLRLASPRTLSAQRSFSFRTISTRPSGLAATSNSQQTMKACILCREVIDKPIAHCMPQRGLIVEGLTGVYVIHNVS
jgi:hypothetical protein